MKKRIFAMLLSMMLIFSFMPTITFATGMETEEEIQNSCTVTAGCILAAEHEGDCVVDVMVAADDETNADADEEEVAFDTVQTMIDALPDAEDITEDNMSDVEAQLDAIDEAKSVLYQNGGDVDSLDMSRYDLAIEALEVLSESGETDAPVLGSSPSVAAVEETALTSTGGELSSGNYYLNDNVTLSQDITIPSGATVTIDLNGKTLTGTGNGPVITVNGTLTLTDSSATTANPNGSGKITGGSTGNGGGIYVGNTFTMEGGIITGNVASSNGGGVYVNSGATFTMNKGTITGNTSNYGGGVYIDGGTFIMNAA